MHYYAAAAVEAAASTIKLLSERRCVEKRKRKVLARSSRKSRDLLFSAQTHSLAARSVIGMCAWKLGDYSAAWASVHTHQRAKRKMENAAADANWNCVPHRRRTHLKLGVRNLQDGDLVIDSKCGRLSINIAPLYGIIIYISTHAKMLARLIIFSRSVFGL